MRARLSIFLLCLALAAPVSLAAQDVEVERQAAALQEQGPALQAFLRRSREGQLEPAFASEVLRGAKALEDQGLPSEPYLLKANEGLAKRIAPPKMAPALVETGTRTRSAATLVDGAMARGAAASPESRRQAILQLQSALMSGRSRGELEKALQAGQAKDSKASLSDLAGKASGLGHVAKEKSPQAPNSPHWELPSGLEKPSKPVHPAKKSPEKKIHSLEKEKGPHGPAFQKPEKSKSSSPGGSGGNSKGKGGGKGHGK